LDRRADDAGGAELSAAELFGSPLTDVITYEGVVRRKWVAGARNEVGCGAMRSPRLVFKRHGAVAEQWLARQTGSCRCFLAYEGSLRSCPEAPLGRFAAAIPSPNGRTADLPGRSALARLLVVLSTTNCSNTRCLAMAETVLDVLLNEAEPRCVSKALGESRVSPRRGQPKKPMLASVILRRSVCESADLHALAVEFKCSDRLVRIAFIQAHGMSPRTYRQRIKVLRAIELLRKNNWDNETVAREVGFRSPKNLYRALEVHTGLPPRQIRRLSEGDLQKLCAKIAAIARGSIAAVAAIDPVVSGSCRRR
jgi:methylphosphotriester-DNA--protein-cysteine methyltransferase